MRHWGWLLVVVGFAVGCGGSTTSNVEDQRSTLLDLDREWSQTRPDMEKFLSYYASDASFYPQGMQRVTGSESIRATITTINSTPGFSIQWSPAKADVSASGDLGYTSGTYEITTNNATGKPVIENGKYVEVWKKQSNGQWKVVEDIFNADTPSTPLAAVAAPRSKRTTPARTLPKRRTTSRRR
jgi:ketosteroid isomerase-like protein